ncbi:ABC transporter permease [Glaciibacter psychrotolerans]|uniref:Peptide/nickel transport system permease protein n=1 Tax=Glaciibacter psychrotolerans TaxID=670054 RepID=A0A7Z0EGX3_9MICO|nr:ABC transporter permease [Leifsonia psychrotolerans]NYJ21345.1 peptide/nickel transport system permease protein [Leifsonia psychrotolerans]
MQSLRSRAVARTTLPLGQWLSIGWLALIVSLAVLVDLLPIPAADTPDYSAYLASPSLSHLLGTDELGRDILSRSLHGARVSLTIAGSTICLGLIVGTTLGVLAGYFRGRIDTVVGVLTDTVLAFPVLILIMTVVAVRGASVEALVVGLAVGTMPAFIRMARAHTLTLARRDFVSAARSIGARHPRVIIGDVLPMIAGPMLVYSLVVAAIVMMAEGSLSFLGYGVPPPAASWGSMIASGRPVLQQAPHVVVFPALMLIFTVMAMNVLGDGYERKRQAR